MSATYIMRSSEDTEQEVVIQWARMNSGRWPALQLLHHIPNGGSRNKREAVKLKRMGVLAGVADLHLPVASAGYNSLYIEMKYGTGRLSASQKAFLKLAAFFNNYCAVCYTAEDAIEILEAYVNHLKPFNYENLLIIERSKKIGTVK